MSASQKCSRVFLRSLAGLRSAALFATTLSAGFACAQPKDFPPDATPVTAESLKGLAGKKFVGKKADGYTWTMDFGADYAYQLSYQGGILDGKVRVDGDKLCQDMRKTLENSCNDVRLKDNVLYYKRNSNGEVVTLIAQ
ncbi:hypothetical protein ACSFA0_25470 [Variovorax sp. LT1P1]|uniref:hypothetical protein n=1 Tax=Variovorax sp. LT1P1 TaxID=3443730 RepID=UPI003F4491B4